MRDNHVKTYFKELPFTDRKSSRYFCVTQCVQGIPLIDVIFYKKHALKIRVLHTKFNKFKVSGSVKTGF